MTSVTTPPPRSRTKAACGSTPKKKSNANGDRELKQFQTELAKLQKRFNELETIITRLFEQNALGVVSDERYISMSANYEKEQSGLKAKIAELQGKIDSSKNAVDNLVKLFSAMTRYVDVPELDRAMLNELIDKIVVHEATSKKVNRAQKLDIYYRLVGQLPRI